MDNRTFVLAALFAPLLLGAQETILPEPVQSPDRDGIPFRYNGLLSVGNSIGSASMVAEGVITTAAHVVFDEEDLAWEDISDIEYYPEYNRPTPLGPEGTSVPVLGFARWTSYGSRVENDDSGEGLSSPDTFNLDFYVGHLSRFAREPNLAEFPEVHIDAENEVGILRDQREKMIVGYPADTDFIDSSDRGLMHRTAPADYFTWWGGLEDFTSTWRDSEDFWTATYDFEGVTTYGGNSGGPMYVRNEFGEWMIAGIVVGSNGSDGVFIRGIDEAAWDLIEETIEARGNPPLRRVEDLVVSQAPGAEAVALDWTDASDEENAYRVLRLDTGGWEILATLEADSDAYLDETALAGHVYHYTVQPVLGNGSIGPRSPVQSVSLSGSNAPAAEHLGEPLLSFVNSGDSNWHLDEANRLRAGKVRSLGASSLKLELVGPGTLDFTWAVSSEENPDYRNPSSPNQDSIYDAVYLYLDGELISDEREPVFISGLDISETRSLQVPPGPHVVEWRYEKDPYTTEGDDTAYLDDLTWTPGSEGSAYPVFGAFAFGDSGWNGSSWFGAHNVDDFPWAGHINLGWLYLRPGNGVDLFAYSPLPELGELYTSPSLFPYFYHFGRESWVLYIEGTGEFGQRAWFWDIHPENSGYFQTH